MTTIFYPFPKDLFKATFVERPNRFIVRCALADTGEIVEAHLADSGRLKEMLVPGKTILLQQNNNPNRKTKFSAVIIEREDGDGWVSINAQLPNVLARLAVEGGFLSELQDWKYVRSEFKMGNSRWDLLLEKAGGGKRMVVEVKGASLVVGEMGMFPDAVTARGAKHVKELAMIARESELDAALLFVAQREDITKLRPAEHIDPAFAEAMREAKAAGVKLLGFRCAVSPEGMTLLDEIDVDV
ncbi:MAG: DNA/RNA nuclease SfsA [Bacillus sp. (in: Bacteria)]|nr:DNA/RNA nuclease SfsA [Bacillus sp. (in: firmicutes)]